VTFSHISPQGKYLKENIYLSAQMISKNVNIEQRQIKQADEQTKLLLLWLFLTLINSIVIHRLEKYYGLPVIQFPYGHTKEKTREDRG
jgi:hypothetical protein